MRVIWMRTHMWYHIALGLASIIILSAFVVAWRDHDIAERTVRRRLQELQEQGQLPLELRDVDVEAFDLHNHDVELPRPVLRRYQVAYFLLHRWFLWVPAVAVVCLGVAWAISIIAKTVLPVEH